MRERERERCKKEKKERNMLREISVVYFHQCLGATQHPNAGQNMLFHFFSLKIKIRKERKRRKDGVMLP